MRELLFGYDGSLFHTHFLCAGAAYSLKEIKNIKNIKDIKNMAWPPRKILINAAIGKERPRKKRQKKRSFCLRCGFCVKDAGIYHKLLKKDQKCRFFV